MGLSRVPVSVAYPMLSVGYVINAIAAYYLFGESVTISKWLGIGFIIVGVWLVARGADSILPGALADLPYLPFARPTLDEATIADVAAVLRSGWITSGPKVKAFEAALSTLAGGRPVRVVASATAALELALQVAGIGPGDEVITPAMTFFAAPNMIVKVGAVPVFVDVEPGTRNLDLAQVAARIGPRTKAIMPTHFGGLPPATWMPSTPSPASIACA